MTRALVLSGGGSVGIAWQTGLAAGLARAGVDLAGADLIVGTSAGSAVGAQLGLGRDMEQQVERYRAAGPQAGAQAAARGSAGGGATSGAGDGMAARMQALMAVMAETFTSEAPEEEVRARIGAFALAAETAPEESFVAAFGYLAGEPWPERYACTAVDAETGAFQVWDAAAGAPLERAVASSCSVPGLFPPITVSGRRYIDGGMRSGTNADLAKGHDRVLVVSLMPMPAAAPAADPRAARYQQRIAQELAAIADAGGTYEIVAPDEEASAVLGVNLMDGSRGADAAEAGRAQASRLASRIADFWG